MIKLKELLSEQPFGKKEKSDKPSPDSGGEETSKKLKINIPDEPFSGGEDKIEEGPSYEYANYMKKIEKAENLQAKEVNNLVKLLQKKGLKKEASELSSKYMKGVRYFDDCLKKLYRKLT